MLAQLVVAVLLVVGVIVLVDVLHRSSGPGSGSPAIVSAPVSTPSSASSSALPTPTSATTSAAPSTSLAPPTTAAPPPAPAAPATPAPSATTLQVFNASRHTGLAQSETDRLRAAGYKVTRVSAVRGFSISQTTVYFTPGDAVQQAEAGGVVARGLAAVASPRPAGVPSTGTLVVYVT